MYLVQLLRTGRVAHDCSIGPKAYLTHKEEAKLVKFLINCSKMGYGKTTQDVVKLIESCIFRKTLNGRTTEVASCQMAGGCGFFKSGKS